MLLSACCAAKKKAPYARVVQQTACSVGKRYTTGNNHVAKIGELKTLSGILLDDQYRFAFGAL